MTSTLNSIIGKKCALLMTAALVVGLVSCKSKPKEVDQSAATTDSSQQTPRITDEAMDFNVRGSDSGEISGLTSINFDYDKAGLTSEGRKRAQGNADWMKSNPNANLQIEGHCDIRGSIEYNLSLGERRAQAVKSYLVTLGVDAKRLNIISYGKERLLANGESEADHAKNRRANFVPLSATR